MMPLILVVDDMPFDRERVVEVAHALGCETREAETGLAALAELEDAEPDCIVSDLCMPVMDGIELLESLRARGDSTPVINITADRTGETRAVCRKLGAVEVLHKPFDIEKLRGLLKAILEERRSASAS